MELAIAPVLRVSAVVMALVAVPSLVVPSPAQAPAHGTVERIKVHGKSLEGNLELDQAALSRPLSAAVDRGDIPGVTAVLVDRNRVLYEGAFGKLDEAHDVAMPADAIFRIASMTKPVTSVAVMMLVEQGKLRLDDRVSKYLPGFDHLQVITSFNADDGTYQTRPAKRAMTLRHLMTHTSGIG
jgi:CubicO group peptidase (beta-lactamase class C family)